MQKEVSDAATGIFNDLIVPRLKEMEDSYGIRATKRASAMMAAIGLQESRFLHRDQVVPGKPRGQIGPATGFWQFEKNGGVKLTMDFSSTREKARACCEEFGVEFDKDAIWKSFIEPSCDGLALSFARLYLYTDAEVLPGIEPKNHSSSWRIYRRVWNPGKPHPETWEEFWTFSCDLAAASKLPY
jgi:hypothetical protein